MPKVEIDDGELANLRAGYNLVNRLHNDPKTSDRIRAAIKDIDPDLKLPDQPVDVRVKPIEEQVGKLAETVESLAKLHKEDMEARRNSSEDAALSARIAAAANRFDFNDEGRKQLIERLVAQKSSDVEGAAALIAADNPKPRPMPSSGFPHLADPFGVRGSTDENMKLLHTDPDRWQQETIEQLVAEQNLA